MKINRRWSNLDPADTRSLRGDNIPIAIDNATTIKGYVDNLGELGANDTRTTLFNELVVSAEDETNGCIRMYPESPDWVEETSAAAFPIRSGHTMNYFAGKFWVMGGYSTTYLNDVWCSEDGVTWTQVNPIGGVIWSARTGHATVVHDDKLWVLGGKYGTYGDYNDVWYTEDGETWVQVKDETVGFPVTSGTLGRSSHAVVSFNEKLWTIGGRDGWDEYRDVYSSEDGISWTHEAEITMPVSTTAIYQHSCIVFDNKMWVIGGRGPSNQRSHAVFSSSDGSTWTNVFENSDVIPHNSSAVVYDNRMWIIGGTRGTTVVNSVFTSLNGTEWSDVTESVLWAARQSLASAASEDIILMAGGYDGSSRLNDVWSYDGEFPSIPIPEKVRVNHIHGFDLAADFLWIRPSYNTSYYYDKELRDWIYLTEFNTFFYQEAEPSGEGEVEGDLWSESTTDDIYVYESSVWVKKLDSVPGGVEQDAKPYERAIDILRNQSLAEAGQLCDFVVDEYNIYFDNTDGKTDLSAKVKEDDKLLIILIP